MAQRYEYARSSDDPPLVLIFLEGSWESLPFEIRLLRPWYESEFCDRHCLIATQRLDIATQGYCIADQHEKAHQNHCAHTPPAAPVTRNSNQI
jgi:hypothetical protein